MSSRPLRLLSLDGGGVRGLTSLLLLKEIFQALENRGYTVQPYEYFDLIGGTSTGGLIAIMLGRLRMTIDETIDAYRQLSPKIFKKKWWAQGQASRYTGAELKHYWFEGKNLKDAVRNLLGERNLDQDMKLLESEDPDCRVFVCAASAVSTHIELLRSYKSRRIGHRNYDCFLWEAVRATSAAPLFFESITLEASKATFVDGGVRANNPIDQRASEARQLWPERSIGCLVSLGTGVKLPKGFSPNKSRLHEVLQSLADIATDADNKAREFRDTREGRELIRSKRYFRYSVSQGAGDVDLADFEKIPYMESMTLPYVLDIDDSIEDCASSLAQASSNNDKRIYDFRNTYYEVPHNLSSVFTGRIDICQQLEAACLPSMKTNALKVQKRFVLYGLGGSGKTQMCLKFAQDHRERFWGIFWIDASSNETITQRYGDFSRIFGLDKDIEALKRWLSNSRDSWVLIFDNADDPSLNISRYFPSGDRGTILITTRNPDCKIHATVGSTELHKMNPEDAVTLLLRAAGLDHVSETASRALARQTVEILGHLALAIIQAGAIIRQKVCNMKEFCDRFSARQQLLSRQLIQADSDYKYTVYTTWEISIGMIKTMSNETASNALALLRLFCFLHFDGISEEILKKAWKNMHHRQLSGWSRSHQLRMLYKMDSEDWDPRPVREAIVLLSSFSLISIDKANNQLSMHPLVHTWAGDRMNPTEQAKHRTLAAATLAMSISRQTSDYRFRRSLLPHVDSLLESCSDTLFTLNDAELEMVDIATKFEKVYRENARYQDALKLGEKIVEVRKRVKGEDHEKTLGSLVSLAICYDKLNRKQEALSLDERVFETAKKTLGEVHPNTLFTMSNLAVRYHDLGRKQEALELREKVFEMRKKILGEEYPDTLRSMADLAVSYLDLGQKQEALSLREKVFELSKKILGEEHPDTLRSMSYLAVSYHDLGQKQEALELREKVFEMRKKILGEEHPDTLKSMADLAVSYHDLGQKQEALELREKVFEMRKKILGEEHPDTLRSMSDLAFIYEDLGRKQEALDLREKVFELRKKILGEEHPDTLRSMSDLAFSYHDLGQKQEALELREKVLEMSKKIPGEEHPDTLKSMSGLAFSYHSLGQEQEALDLREKVFEMRKKILGEEHPDTLKSMSYLANSYHNLGQKQEALELREKVFEMRKKILGEEHPDTLRSMSYLAISYHDLGQKQESLELREKVFELRKNILGEEHPDTLRSRSRLAKSYHNLGRKQEALDLSTKALEMSKRTSGDEHPGSVGETTVSENSPLRVPNEVSDGEAADDEAADDEVADDEVADDEVADDEVAEFRHKAPRKRHFWRRLWR